MKLNNLSFLNLFTGIYDNFEERIYDNFEERFGAATNYKSVALPIELWGLGKLNKLFILFYQVIKPLLP